MVERVASCRCGSVCHCRDCQRRSGSAFDWSATGDNGTGTFTFCPACGTTIAYRITAMPGLTAIPVGTFTDPAFPAPTISHYEARRHPWVAIAGEGIVRYD